MCRAYLVGQGIRSIESSAMFFADRPHRTVAPQVRQGFVALSAGNGLEDRSAANVCHLTNVAPRSSWGVP